MNSTLSTCAGIDVFLEQELEPVGQRLQQPERPDAVRPDAVLHPGRDLPLGQHQVHARRRGCRPATTTIVIKRDQ